MGTGTVVILVVTAWVVLDPGGAWHAPPGRGPAPASLVPGSLALNEPARKVVSIAPDEMGEILAVGSGLYIEDFSNGKLWHWDRTDGLALVARPPSGGSTYGYIGMAAGTVGGYFTIYLITPEGPHGGLWACVAPTPFGCGHKSQFIPLPAKFCAAEFDGCVPAQLALYKGNLYYTDGFNAQEVELFGASGFTVATVYHSFPASSFPVGLFIDSSGNHWVNSGKCSGQIWKNGALKYKLGEALDSVIVGQANPSRSSHLYVGWRGFCTSTPGHVLDVTDGMSLPTFSGAGPFLFGGLTSNSSAIYLADFYTGSLYRTTDTA